MLAASQIPVCLKNGDAGAKPGLLTASRLDFPLASGCALMNAGRFLLGARRDFSCQRFSLIYPRFGWCGRHAAPCRGLRTRRKRNDNETFVPFSYFGQKAAGVTQIVRSFQIVWPLLLLATPWRGSRCQNVSAAFLVARLFLGFSARTEECLRAAGFTALPSIYWIVIEESNLLTIKSVYSNKRHFCSQKTYLGSQRKAKVVIV